MIREVVRQDDERSPEILDSIKIGFMPCVDIPEGSCIVEFCGGSALIQVHIKESESGIMVDWYDLGRVYLDEWFKKSVESIIKDHYMTCREIKRIETEAGNSPTFAWVCKDNMLNVGFESKNKTKEHNNEQNECGI